MEQNASEHLAPGFPESEMVHFSSVLPTLLLKHLVGCSEDMPSWNAVGPGQSSAYVWTPRPLSCSLGRHAATEEACGNL